MGVPNGFSSSCCFEWETTGNMVPNPVPTNFVIQRIKQVGSLVIVFVVYPDCTNYEGHKIILYKGVTVGEVRSMTSLDPHFSESGITPFMRFVPTEEGWNTAIKVAEGISNVRS